MSMPWHEWCRNEGFSVTRNTVTVSLTHGRRHKVRVVDLGTELLLSAIVERNRSIDETFWEDNRDLRLCGLQLNEEDNLVVESKLIQSSLTADDFLFVVRHVAATADRFEAELSPYDTE